ncbi:MAG: response regulator [Pseudomonadota bacterium]
MRILVVDDEWVSREKIKKIMESLGQCFGVEGGEAALEAFGAAWGILEPYDLILLDVDMPGLSGIETLKKIRGKEQEMGLAAPALVKVVMITSMSGSAVVKEALDAGCNDYIIKPVKKLLITEKLQPLFPPEITRSWQGAPTFNGSSIEVVE